MDKKGHNLKEKYVAFSGTKYTIFSLKDGTVREVVVCNSQPDLGLARNISFFKSAREEK
jgi:hypothetical protein